MPEGGTGKRLKICGWGYEGNDPTPEEHRLIEAGIAERFGVTDTELVPPPTEAEIELAKPRVGIPETLEAFCSAGTYDRALHMYGKSCPDYVRQLNRVFEHAPDFVAYPRSEDEIEAVLDWATGARVAVIPFGGGSSVVGGVEPKVGDGFAGAITLNLKHFDKVLEIDETSRAARVQAGTFGPALEAQLKPHGKTFRYYPQSFEFSTLGGWIATRGGGHYATVMTHVDDLVESVRALTMKGVYESFRLPGSGAGPSPDRLLIGSEGALGVITEAWVRLQDRPVHRAGTSVAFDDFYKAAECVRAMTQSGLYPTNCRLLDRNEARANGVADGSADILVLAFESADHPVEAWMERALEICRDMGGRPDSDQLQAKAGGHREGASGAWRNAFIRMPYLRDATMGRGLCMDTFETAITWERFPEFHAKIKAKVEQTIREVTGRPGLVTCRFTHVYADGPAPYFSFYAYTGLAGMLEGWWAIKTAASDLLNELGGTITHHHAVGRDHMTWYQKQRPEPFAAALSAAKTALDPAGILNPGVLLPPQPGG
jgi:alkyldihydroxyacetonephosphate synthase